ncbi:MAG TPA: cyclic nucleotide-binding domain-containing protein [Vicinamibacteria bacterium]|nr:cyclic nucleotide-binding domain-containing protein [Vicinamibacteria bacterium]
MSVAKQSPFAQFLTQYKKGDFIFHQGEEGDEMFIVQSGQVAIRKQIGSKRTTVTVLEKGDFFGEMAVLERLPRSADAEVVEDAGIITINSQTFGEMIRRNPEIAVRMLRKYSMRMREYSEQLENLLAQGSGVDEVQLPDIDKPPAQAPEGTVPSTATARAYFVAKESGKIYPIYKDEILLGRYDSVTGHRPEIDLTDEDQNRNVSRRHARLLYKDNTFYIAEEIGTMNGTYINGERIPTGVLTPIRDGDEVTLCRVPVIFKVAQ